MVHLQFARGQCAGFIERDDLMSSVALWYQIEPHKPWPALPPGPERLPFTEQVLLKGHEAVASAKHSDQPVISPSAAKRAGKIRDVNFHDCTRVVRKTSGQTRIDLYGTIPGVLEDLPEFG